MFIIDQRAIRGVRAEPVWAPDSMMNLRTRLMVSFKPMTLLLQIQIEQRVALQDRRAGRDPQH
jgi:hypothetical protein